MAVTSTSTIIVLLSMLCGSHGWQVLPTRSLKPKFVSLLTVSTGKPPSFSSVGDVQKQLEPVNASLDKVSALIAQVNSTAYGMLDQFMTATDGFADILKSLQKATDAAKKSPLGGNDASEAVTDFISLANKTLEKAEAQVPAAVDEATAKFAEIMLEVYTRAKAVFEEYGAAAQLVVDLAGAAADNATVELAKSAKKSKAEGEESTKQSSTEHAIKSSDEPAKTSRSLASADVDEQSSTSSIKAKSAHTSKQKKSLVQLAARAHGTHGMLSSSAVEKSLSGKGGGQNPCQAATVKIVKANSTLADLSEAIGAVNTTALTSLVAISGSAYDALAMINTTLRPALDAADDIPSSLLKPVTKGLDLILTVNHDLSADVEGERSESEAQIAKTTKALKAAYGLTESMQAAVDEACLSGVCGSAAQKKCEAAASGS